MYMHPYFCPVLYQKSYFTVEYLALNKSCPRYNTLYSVIFGNVKLEVLMKYASLKATPKVFQKD